jgi:hypothetical protein
MRSKNKQVATLELLKKHSMNLSPFLHIASASRIKFSASSPPANNCFMHFFGESCNRYPKGKDDGTV